METRVLPARLTLITHGVTPAVRRGAFPADEGLAVNEREKIAAIGWVAPRAQAAWCAAELRCRQTAEALGLTAAVTRELREVEYGAWSGRGMDEVGVADAAGLAAWLADVTAAPHGGESIAELMARVKGWMDECVDKGHTVAVTHAAVVRAAVVCALGAPVESFWRVEVAPLTVTDLRWSGRGWVVRQVGCPL